MPVRAVAALLLGPLLLGLGVQPPGLAVQGGRCVAVALPYPFGAAMSLSAPSARLPKERLPEVAATLQRAAGDIAQEVRNAGR